MRTRPAWLLALALGVVSACGGDVHHSQIPPEPSFTVVDFGNVQLAKTDQSEIFEVTVVGASALVIVADGGSATDIDIDLLRTPSGTDIITENPADANPLTGDVSPQQAGGSVAVAMVPSSATLPLENGTYRFRLASFDAAGTRVAATVRLRAIINARDPSAVGTLRLNLFLVGAPGLSATSSSESLALGRVLDQVERFFGQVGVRIEIARTVDVSGDPATRLSLLDLLDSTTDRLVPDLNLNRQSDEMDELFALSADAGNTAVNVFFVDEFFHMPERMTASGGQPGPPIVQGTSQSGIVAATRGTLDEQRDEDLNALGVAIACELASYLGAPPGCDTEEGFTAAQAFVVARNPAVQD